MPWRRACPEVVKGKADEALQATIYILMQTGPTGFVLKEEGTIKKVKVSASIAYDSVIDYK